MLSKIEEILSNIDFLDYKKHIPIYKIYKEDENVLKSKLEKLEGWNTLFGFIWFILFFLNFKIIDQVPVLGILIMLGLIILGFSKVDSFINFITSGKYKLIKEQIKEVEDKINTERNILIGYENKVKEYYERELNDFYHENLYKKRAKGEIYFNNLDLFLNKIKIADAVSREMLIKWIKTERHLDYALSKEWYRENKNNNVNYSKKEVDSNKSNIYINNQNTNSLEKQYTKKEIISNHEKYRVARKIDWNEVNKSKSLIGKKGEEIVFLLEKEYLIEIGRGELADKIRHISKEEGDGLGYDILSFFKNGEEKYIEVKSTTIENSNSFMITKNELDFLKENRKNAFIYKVYVSDTEEPKLKVILAEDMLNDSEIIPNRYKVVL